MKVKEYTVQVPEDQEAKFFEAMHALGFLPEAAPDRLPGLYERMIIEERIMMACEPDELDWETSKDDLKLE